MAGNVATYAEVQKAKKFLSLINAPTNNNYLILAVVAWMRVEGPDFDVYAAANQLIKGSVYTPVDLNLPKNMESEQNEANRALMEVAKQYQLILAAAKSGLPSDFLMALALSNWDQKHYGGLNQNNALFTTYSSFTGLTLAPPQASTQKPVVVRQPKVPPVLRPPVYDRDQPDGFEAARFYRARHPGGRG